MIVSVHNAKKPIITKHPLVLITGDGRSLWEDKGRFLAWEIPHDTYCIGRSIKLFENVDHFADVDSGVSIWWAQNLPRLAGSPLRHTLGDCDGYDVDWDVEQSDYNMEDVMWHGSTALFAVLTSLAMGYEKIVLAGCPLDTAGHWYWPEEERGPRWNGETFMAWLDFARLPESVFVKSLSGYTKDILGEPSKEWLIGDTWL